MYITLNTFHLSSRLIAAEITCFSFDDGKEKHNYLGENVCVMTRTITAVHLFFYQKRL